MPSSAALSKKQDAGKHASLSSCISNNKKSGNKSLRCPSFVKALLPNFSEHLRIPPAFMKKLGNHVPTEVLLAAPGGDKWTVGLSTDAKGNIYFHHGWKKFANDHKLEVSDVLVFEYNWNLQFRVMMFDKSACEKEATFHVNNCEKNDTANVLGRGRKVSNLPIIGNHQRDLAEAVHNEGSCGNLGNIQVESYVQQCKSLSSSGICQFCKSDVLEKLQEKSVFFSSKFPFFAKRITKSAAESACLAVPKCFSRNYFSNEVKELNLVDPLKRAYKVTYVQRCRITGGWIHFARCNDIKAGDACIFELIQRMELHVHIFRLS